MRRISWKPIIFILLPLLATSILTLTLIALFPKTGYALTLPQSVQSTGIFLVLIGSLGLTILLIQRQRLNLEKQNVLLQESKGRYRQLLELYSDHAIILADITGRIISNNQATASIFAYANDEIVGREIKAFFLPGEQTKSDDARRLALQAGRYQEKVQLVRKDGRSFPAELTISPVRNSYGEHDGFAILIRDLSTQEVTAENLQPSAANFHQLLLGGIQHFGIFYIDLEGRIISWNPGVHKVLGYQKDEFIGLPFAMIFTPEDRDAGAHEIELKIAAKAGRAPDNRWHLRKDGTRFWAIAATNPLHNSNAELIGYVKIIADNTAQKITQEALLDAKERLRSIVNSVLDGIITIDANGTIETVNQAAERIFGYRASEMINKNVTILMPEPFRGEHQNYLDRYLTTGEKKIIGIGREVLGVRSTGEEFPMELAVCEFRYRNKRMFTGVVRDISTRKMAEEALRNSKERLQILSEISSELILHNHPSEALRGFFAKLSRNLRIDFYLNYMLDETTGQLDLANSDGINENKLLRIKSLKLGESISGYVAQSKKSLILEDLASLDDQRYLAIKEAGVSAYACFPLLSLDHLLGTLSFGLMGRKHFKKDELELLHTLADQIAIVWDRKLTEERLRLSEKNFRQLADAIPHMVWTAKPDKSIEYMNKRWFEYTGMQASDAINGSWLETIHPEDRENFISAWDEAARSCETLAIELRFLSKSAAYRWHLCLAVPIIDDKGNILHWFGTTTDIQDQRQTQEELESAKEAAEIANQSKSTFLANMSHEIRTPLGAILGFGELLKDPKLSEKERLEYIEIINRNGNELGSLIDDILDLSKVEAGRLEVERKKIDLESLLNDVSSSLMVKIQEKNLDLEVNIASNVPKIIETDPTRLRQILVNIVGNAIKFTDAGLVQLNVSTRHVSNKRKLVLTVKDTGRGIRSEEIARLFQPFSQADVSTMRNYGGTGLGLTLSRKLAQLLGGDLVLTESTYGKGSTFTITLDCICDDDDAQTKDEVQASLQALQAPVSQVIKGELTGLRILLAEDTVDIQVLMQRLLKDSGAVLNIVDNGAEAVKAAMQENFDIILMDVQMPVMDGYQAASELRAKNYKRPILALTAHAMRDEREKCIRAGCNEQLTKPLNYKLLVKTIRKYVRKNAAKEVSL